MTVDAYSQIALIKDNDPKLKWGLMVFKDRLHRRPGDFLFKATVHRKERKGSGNDVVKKANIEKRRGK